MPLALLSGTAVLTAVYVAFNYALLCAASPADMAGRRSVPALVFAGVSRYPVSDLTLLASALICLGSLSAMFMVNTRVMFAMARDGLAFRRLAWMSRGQAPVWSILLGATIACLFVANRRFGEILRIYFLASAVIFGLNYFSLVVFRARDRRAAAPPSPDVYRVPAGSWIVALLILFELLIAASIVQSDIREKSWDSAYTLALLAGLALVYLLWRRIVPAEGRSG
jgi:APA family basic amino acid/polyamine antiporter